MYHTTLTFPSEVAAVQAHLLKLPPAAAPQVWLAKPLAVRQALQERWGVAVHAAYKPLVSFVAERLLGQWHSTPPRQVRLEYPVLAGLYPERFLLESYPLSGWLQELEVSFEARPMPFDADLSELNLSELAYTLHVLTAAGEAQRWRVPVPARWATDLTGMQVLRPTARVQVGGQTVDILSDTERLWDAYAALLPTLPLAAQPPYFGRLTIEAWLCAPDDPLPYGHEALSLQEGLAEDLYFGTLEYLQARAGLAGGSRTLQPGQIVPLVRDIGLGEAPRLRVSLEALPAVTSTPEPAALPDLATLGRPLTLSELGSLGTPTHTFSSVQGRPIAAYQRSAGSGGMLLTAGQHANETTGVAAAAQFLSSLPERLPLPLACIPLENPDGYALHAQLCDIAPTHMHHAARYTALGDDLEYRPQPTHEKAARVTLGAGAALHVNLHGYPAHEWTRPMSGYAPRHFEAWALPKGFFVLLRYAPGEEARARDLAEAVTLSLSGLPDLMAFNDSQRRVYEAHTAARPYELWHGTPILLQERTDQLCPLTLITEFPDETVYGDLFRLGAAAQLRVIEAAWVWLGRQR